MLSHYRVLDLSDERGMFCSYLLAQLGAQVVVIEPPGGSASRSLVPVSGGQNSRKGLWWEAYARGKQSLVLDLETSEDRSSLHSLVAEADVVVESFTGAQAQRLGVTQEALAEINPAIVVVSISPFGRTGPKAEWPATDLSIWASSGALVLAGDSDRAPVRTSVPQAFLHAGADAAGAVLLALRARSRSGQGQHVDVSAQQSSAQAALSSNLSAPNNSGITIRREAGGLAGIFPIQLVWPCKDGFVAITFLFGPAFDRPNKRLLTWVHEAGYCTVEDVETDWGALLARMVVGGEEPEAYFDLCDKVKAFTLAHNKSELFEVGLKRGVYIARIMNVAELLAEKHFRARGYWQQIRINQTDVAVPGAFARFSSSPLQIPGPAPALNTFKGFAPRAPLDTGQEPGDEALPLTGLKVLDFMWVIAGPTFTRTLADYGATVIKLESTLKLDPARASPPFKDGVATIEHGTPFANFNAGKLGITVDPRNPVGREVILDLVRWADVVTESFSPKAMKDWGLDYQTLKQINPDLIMVSSCLMGQTGPRAQVPGYGNMAAAITGFYELTGWADRSPAGPYLAYTDGVAPRFMLIALLAALEHRRKTKQGQHIDLSQAEAAIHMIAPAILDHGLNEHTWTRIGNRDLTLCPHAVFPARGEDRWVAIACQSDEAWRALCGVAGFADQLADESLATVAARLAREAELETLISQWSQNQDEYELQAQLIEAGVAAHVVQNSEECVKDPQLVHRRHFINVHHSSVGNMVIEGSRFQLSRTPAHTARAHPGIGEHNAEILTDILGYDVDRMADVFASLAMQ
ncbi:MAG: CoA transferase [Proteobacteria bacterium]|nr:CoA transferase [Pseudomonadota bacterium]